MNLNKSLYCKGLCQVKAYAALNVKPLLPLHMSSWAPCSVLAKETEWQHSTFPRSL